MKTLSNTTSDFNLLKTVLRTFVYHTHGHYGHNASVEYDKMSNLCVTTTTPIELWRYEYQLIHLRWFLTSKQGETTIVILLQPTFGH